MLLYPLQRTPSFMAVEAQLLLYWDQLPGKPPFLHNFLHDIEGLWWIMMSNLYSTTPAATKANISPEVIVNRQEKANNLFLSTVKGNMERHAFFTFTVRHEEYKQSLPLEYQEVADAMAIACEVLWELYTKVRPEVLEDKAFAGVHDQLILCFKKIRDCGVEVVVLLHDLLEEKKKEAEKEKKEAETSVKERTSLRGFSRRIRRIRRQGTELFR
ncbi:hypothetical protein E1B28_012738 [Marasmius oreades]|uniref:Uncharacterized protein n=1 Tax=Marasmius oreades TaxID=181124 RepID=A0A9P7UNK3_9AGAR|nr:uncharacterized protein E1B28_012738 [Marasmius oreades]KAG7088772.1 hypothetical protein E1B28_012738 [Marasmius oreades]